MSYNLFDYKVRWCPVCSQGWVEIVKDKASGTLFVTCSECEAEWLSPEEIGRPNAGSRNKFGQIVAPTEAEIDAKGWRKFTLRS